MSKMSELSAEIFDMIELGDSPIEIASLLEIPVSWVYETLEQEEYSPFDTCNS